MRLHREIDNLSKTNPARFPKSMEVKIVRHPASSKRIHKRSKTSIRARMRRKENATIKGADLAMSTVAESDSHF